MRLKILIALFVVINLASCKSKSAFEYNQNFVKKENGLLPDITRTEQNVAKFVALQQYDSIAVAGEKMEALVEAKIKEIKDEPAPDANGAEKFKAAIIHYFEYIKSMYTSYKNWGNAKTEEERNNELEKIKEIAGRKMSVVNDLRSAQSDYASANNFRLEKIK